MLGVLGLGLLALGTTVPALVLAPATATVTAGGAGTTFTASGRVPPYTFTEPTNNSGGSITTHATTVDYVPGVTGGVSDTVRVTDSLGHTADATITVNAADPYALETWEAYFDETTITVSTGSNINHWNDRTGNGHAWNVQAGAPQEGTLNGFNVVVLGGSDSFAQSSASSAFFTNGASGTGYAIAVGRMSAVGAAGANVGLTPGIFGLGSNYGGLTVDSTNGVSGYAYDTTYEVASTGASPGTTNTKVFEWWWDSTHVYVRVNGGTTYSHACTNGPGSLATAMAFGRNAGANYVAGSFHMIGFLGAVPGNQAALVSAAMTKYGAA